ncbi:MAG: Gfo/Idh/MocA family oxidoreductase [Syntrophales bacterium]|jgi:predicted dehydrogenase|nr:Gfo/Idh/MocA family oxidoreductase [Syntrophales bacterium]MCK9527717.1 Gfo/Idh/MocA family oxidoreductase [Syntrophales bacterium]MDX9921628.1 Gfo/Idh/MocA family oxidoreductase [Syntrophales bacterium]
MGMLKVGVVGIGHLGTYHLQKYEMIEDCVIAGVSDIQQDRTEQAAGRYRCEGFTDYRRLIGKVDAVSIATPTVTHHAIARDFLAAGVDVLLEKPMTLTLEEADDLLEAAEQGDRILQVGFIERFNPAVIALEKIIERPVFIEAHRLHPFYSRGTDVDVILDLMIHDLDLVLAFVASPIRSVDAVGVSVLSDKVDIANVRLSFENGCVANITASRVTGKKLQKIRFFGFEGYHSVDYAKRELVSLKKHPDGQGGVEISMRDVEIGQHDPLEAEIRHFVQSVIARTPPRVSGREGRNSLELALRVAEVMEDGSGVPA